MRVCCFSLLLLLAQASAWAGWKGAGVPGGTAGTDINNSANWDGGVIDDDFSGITESVTLTFTEDYTANADLNFGTAAGVTHQVRVEGSATVTLNGSFIIGPQNAASWVTFARGLTLAFAGTGTRYLSGFGQMAVDARMTGDVNLYLSTVYGKPTVRLSHPDNAFTGIVYASGSYWRMFFTSLADGGEPCAFGTGTQFGGRYQEYYSYIGTRDAVSDRTYLTRRDASPILRNDSACGGLRLTGAVSSSDGGSNGKYWFGGISEGEGRIDGDLADDVTRFEKEGSGIWRLTGHNTFPGQPAGVNPDIRVKGGTLIADFSRDSEGAGSNRLFAAGRTLNLDNGALEILGKSGSGNTTVQQFGICSSILFGANRLRIDGNGGDGTEVILDGLVVTGSTAHVFFELAGNAALRTTNALLPDAGAVRNVNGVLLSRDGGDAYLMIRDATGHVGFPAQDAENRIVRNTNAVALTEANASSYNGDHLILDGDLTRTANLSFSTLTLNATDNPVTLDLGGKLIQTDNTAVGRGILAYGAHPVTITNGTHGSQASSYLFHYGTEKFTWAVTGSKVFTLGGSGLIEMVNPIASTLYMVGGTIRAMGNYTWTSGRHYIAGEAVLELGADVNGETPGDYSRLVSNNSSDSVNFFGGGGFSAYGQDRTVNLGGAGAKLTWGLSYFVPDGKPFVLSSPYADATLIFENDLDLYLYPREFRVRNGSAAVDARLTGTISSDSIGGSLVKSGDGVLELTGPQTYRGSVSVIGGGLRLGADNLYTDGKNELVLRGAVLDAGGNTNAFAALELLADSVIALGDGSAAVSFADSNDKTWTGTLTLTGTLGAQTLRFGTDAAGLTPEQLAAIQYGGKRFRLDGQGYLAVIPPGTVISLN
jgi:autotransporter-associated beta strand protein